MDQATHNKIVSFIWGIADDVLRDLYVRGKYRDVILPMMRAAPPRRGAGADQAGRARHEGDARQSRHHQPGRSALARPPARPSTTPRSSPCATCEPRGSQQQLKADFEAYLDGFSPNVQEILDNFEFRNQIPTLSKADALGTLIEKFLDPAINLSPNPVLNGDGSVKHPGLDNHAMGTIFEELVRRFNEENNEEAGEHWTPRDAVKLMANLIFLPIADQIESGTYLLYDGACGTGGMLTVAEETLAGSRRSSTASRSPPTSTGRRSTPRPTPSAKADLLLKGEGEEADNIVGGAGMVARCPTTRSRRASSTSCSPTRPTAKAGRSDLERMGGKDGMRDPRFMIEHAGDPEYVSGHALQRRPDAVPGQHAVEDEAQHAARQPHRRGAQRLVAVHRRRRPGRKQHPPLDHRERLAGSDRRAAAQHVLQHRHRHLYLGAHQPQAGSPQGKVQLIDATQWFKPLRKNLGKKNCELAEDDISRICDTFLAFEETEQSKIFPNAAFGYWKVTVERPLRIKGIDADAPMRRRRSRR